jgi:hypothetical protein
MRALMDFTFKLGAEFSLNADLTVEKADRYFLLNKNLKGIIGRDFRANFSWQLLHSRTIKIQRFNSSPSTGEGGGDNFGGCYEGKKTP